MIWYPQAPLTAFQACRRRFSSKRHAFSVKQKCWPKADNSSQSLPILCIFSISGTAPTLSIFVDIWFCLSLLERAI